MMIYLFFLLKEANFPGAGLEAIKKRGKGLPPQKGRRRRPPSAPHRPRPYEARHHPGSRFLADSRLTAPAPTRICQERSEEHTSELQSHLNLVCRLLLEKKKQEPQCVRTVARLCHVDVTACAQ